MAIVGRAMRLTGHFTIETLHAAVESDDYHISLATVYNTVQLMVDSGLVRRHSFSANKAEYERVNPVGSSHIHLVCTTCGKIKEVKRQDVANNLQAIKFTSFHADYVDLTVYGICSRCARKRQRSK